MEYHYRTKGTCSQEIIIDLEGDTIRSVNFIGGCNGNLQGIGSLVRGMNADEVIRRCRGIRCGAKSTSCPDQLAKALLQAKKQTGLK
mgnify:FL=1